MQQNSIGKFLRQKRENTGCSLNQFALDIGIEPSTLCRIENEKQDIKFKALEKIATGFKIKLSELISEYEQTTL